MRACPFRDCKSTIADSVFACRRHWFQLTPRQKQTVQKAYDDYLRDEIGIEELRRIQQRVLDANQGAG